MYEYIFVETSLGGLWAEPKHQETITKYANEGWRLVQVLPTNFKWLIDSYNTPFNMPFKYSFAIRSKTKALSSAGVVSAYLI